MKNYKREYYKDFLKREKIKEKIVLLHILLGHGLNTRIFERILQKAKNKSIIILEHNPQSSDFKNKSFNYTLTYLEKKIKGKKAFIQGNTDNMRNVVLYKIRA